MGGSSRVPLVQKMVCDVLKKDVSFDADPELAVCQGAVYLGIMERKDEETQEAEEKRKAEGEAKGRRETNN